MMKPHTLRSQQRVTVIFGMGGVFPRLFQALHKYNRHVLSYQMIVQSPWPLDEFVYEDVGLFMGERISGKFAERPLHLSKEVCFREVRCLTSDGRQIAVIASDRKLDLRVCAASLYAEYTAQRFQKYQQNRTVLEQLNEEITGCTSEQAEAERQNPQFRSVQTLAQFKRLSEFVRALKLICFRAEQMVEQILREHLSQSDDANKILQDLFNGAVDLVPNVMARTLNVRLHLGINRLHEKAIHHLFDELSATYAIFPGTELRLKYEIVEPRQDTMRVV